jgi:hypothetical protein
VRCGGAGLRALVPVATAPKFTASYAPAGNQLRAREYQIRRATSNISAALVRGSDLRLVDLAIRGRIELGTPRTNGSYRR